MYKKRIYQIFVIFIFCVFASATTDDSSSSSSSSSSSPYSNVNVALKECKEELTSDTNRGKYDGLSDTAMYRAMMRDQENCMARYGHYPNN